MKNHLFVVAGALVALSPAVFAENAKVCFEAEGCQALKTPLKKVTGKGSDISLGGYIEIPWDKNVTKGIGDATYKFKAKTAGVYYLWARTFWANGCGNSILASVNGSDGKILGEDGTYDAWHWVGGRVKVKLNAGDNTLILHNRETGVRVDQFFLCTDPDYTPVGKRKPTTGLGAK